MDEYKPMEILEKEEKDLSKAQKEDLFSKIYEIYLKLDKADYMEDFLNADDDTQDDFTDLEKEEIKSKGKKCLYIVGSLFFIIHLIIIYEINDIINSIEEELIASIKSYVRGNKREPTDDFYKNFNILNNRLPDYSPFFISSFLSEYLYGLLGFDFLITISSSINILVLSFGFSNFEFNIERNHYKNYALNEFIYLYIIYLILCISQGTIALLPLNIIKEGFKFYDKLDEEKNSEINNPLNTEEKEINNKEKNNDLNIKEINNNNNVNSEVKLYELKHFFIFYLFSVFASIFIKIFLDKTYIDEYKYTSKEKVHYFFIISYFILTILSIFYYKIFLLYALKKKKKKKLYLQ